MADDLCGCGHDYNEHGPSGDRERACQVDGCRCSWFVMAELVRAAKRERWACSCDRNDTNLDVYHADFCPRGRHPETIETTEAAKPAEPEPMGVIE